MADWLPLAFLALVTVVLAAMPWRRPHPNHEFILDILRLLGDEDSERSNPSSSAGSPAPTQPVPPTQTLPNVKSSNFRKRPELAPSAPIYSRVLEIDRSKGLLFRVSALFGENTRENDLNVVGTAPALGVWRMVVLHYSGFLRINVHDAGTSRPERIEQRRR